MRALVVIALIALIASAACSQDRRAAPSAPAADAGSAAAKPPSPFETFAETAPRVGDPAPTLSLRDLEGRTVTLSDATARGPVVLVFGSFT